MTPPGNTRALRRAQLRTVLLLFGGYAGAVHARVSVDFVTEFGCYLGAPLRRP
jgi:hypothetical protein